MKVAAFQLNTQALSNARLDYYLRICEQKKVELVVLGEYVINSFFTDIKTLPLQVVLEQSNVKIKAIKEFSKTYNLCIVAPLIIKQKDKIKKVCLIAKNGSASYYEQQVLMPYSHWNEDAFFDNDKKPIKLHTFKVNNKKIALMFAYELHFDEFFKNFKNIDLLVVPCANTYSSNTRWKELIKTRAFLKNTNILRVNRIGSVKVGEDEWKFYGNSFLCNGFGEIVQELGENEELLIFDLEKSNEAAKMWQFAKVGKEIESRIL